jgi:hypothetical protein
MSFLYAREFCLVQQAQSVVTTYMYLFPLEQFSKETKAVTAICRSIRT